MEQKVADLNLGEQLWVWFEANKKQVICGAVIAAVLALAVSLYLWNASQKRVKAGMALSQVLANAAFSGGVDSASAEAYLKVANEHAGTSAGAQALLLAGEAFFAQGNYTEAQTQFQRFARENPGSPLTPQALLGTAASLDAQGKSEEAARAYKEVSDRYPNANVTAPARFALARIYEAQNNFEQARTLYEDLSRSDAYSSLGSAAMMRLEELKSKIPPPVTGADAAAPTPAATLTNLTTNPAN